MGLLRRIKSENQYVDRLSPKHRAIYLALFGVFCYYVLEYLSTTPLWLPVKIALFVLALLVLAKVFSLLRRFSEQRRAKKDARHAHSQAETMTSSTGIIPPIPDYQPTANEDVQTARLEIVDPVAELTHESIAATNRLAQAVEESNRRADEEIASKQSIAQDDRLYWDERFSFLDLLFKAHKILISAVVAVVAGGILFAVYGTTINIWYTVALFIGIAPSCWYIGRQFRTWHGRKIAMEGNWISIKYPRSIFFLLFADDDTVAIVNCDNIKVFQSKFEGAIWRSSSSVSIDTPRKNAENGDNPEAVRIADLFANLKHVRHADDFRKLLQRRHDELMFGQSPTMRQIQS